MQMLQCKDTFAKLAKVLDTNVWPLQGIRLCVDGLCTCLIGYYYTAVESMNYKGTKGTKYTTFED